MFSKACEYGIKAVIYIAQQSEAGRKVGIKEISERIGSPLSFTAKILQALSADQLIKSYKGPTGGYALEHQDASRLALYSIVRAIDGDKIYSGCGLGLEKCNSEKPCPIHHKFAKVRDELKKMLKETTIAELASGLNNADVILKL